jgi:hypothetical protein
MIDIRIRYNNDNKDIVVPDYRHRNTGVLTIPSSNLEIEVISFGETKEEINKELINFVENINMFKKEIIEALNTEKINNIIQS